MNTTTFLAQVWGPAVLALGLGFFVSQRFYTRLYKNIQNEPLATLAFGIIMMAVGVVHIFAHNVWTSWLTGLISFLGWATFIKGAVFLIFPNFVDKAADWEVAKKLVPIAGILTLLIGLYLSWVGYIA